MLHKSCGAYIFMESAWSSHCMGPVISALHYVNNSVIPYVEIIHGYCQFVILTFLYGCF